MNKSRLYVGILLIVVGLFALVGAVVDIDGGKLFGAALFAAVGICLLLAYTQTSKIGFLIPACNTLAMGVFIALTLIPGFEQKDNLAGAMFFATQGLAFGAMYLIGIRRPWPLIVTVWLALFALFVGLVAESSLPGSVIGGSFFVMMGLGFLALKLCGVRGQWPVYTGLAALLFGLCIPMISGEIWGFPAADLVRQVLIPAVLIVIGVIMIFARRGAAE